MSLAFIGVSPVVAVASVVLIGLLILGAWQTIDLAIVFRSGDGGGGWSSLTGILMAAMKEVPPFASPAGIIAIGAGTWPVPLHSW